MILDTLIGGPVKFYRVHGDPAGLGSGRIERVPVATVTDIGGIIENLSSFRLVFS